MEEAGKQLSIRGWIHFVVRHPFYIIAAIFTLTLLFGLQIPKLRFQTSIYDLTIQDLPETARYQAFKKTFGSDELILVVVKTEDVFEPHIFEALTQLADRLSLVQGIKRVISLPGIKKEMDITGKWRVSDFKSAIEPVTLFRRNLISEDGKSTGITLVLEDLQDKTDIIASVEEIIQQEKGGVSAYQIGMPLVSEALASYTQSDFFWLPPMTFLLIALVLLASFKRARGVLVPLGTVMISLIWTFGLMAWTGTPLSMLTMIVPVFLIAVGTAYCMYIFTEYLFRGKESGTPTVAALSTFEALALPTSLAVGTTVIGLGSLLVNRISAIREFALFSCFGILTMFVMMLAFLPAIYALLPLPKVNAPSAEPFKGPLARMLSWVVTLNLRGQRFTLPFFGSMVLLGLLGIFQLRVETSPVEYFKEGTSIRQRFHDIYRDLAGSFPINVVIDTKKDSYYETSDHLEEIRGLQAYLGTLDGVDKTISFADYMMLINYATNHYHPESYGLPEESFEVRMLVNNYKTMLGQDMFDRFMTPDLSKTNILLRTHLSSSRDLLRTKEMIMAHLRDNFPSDFDVQVTGFGIVVSQSSQILTQGQGKSLSFTLVLIFGIMFLLFLSIKVGLIAILANGFPIVVNFGLMGWLGMELSVATSLVASIAVGLAVDDTIHYLVRYNREFKKNLDKQRALDATIRSMGRPMILTTVTIGLGFSVLMLSHFGPTVAFGLMMVVTLVSALVGDLILLPSLMMRVELVTLWDLLSLKLGKEPQKGIPLLKGLSRSQVRYILTAGALKTFKKDDVLFRKGEESDSMYAVISGELLVMDDPGDSNACSGSAEPKIINVIRKGDVVGEMGMIRACARSATVVASADSDLLQINDRMITRLHWLYPPTAQKFLFNLMVAICDRLEKMTQCYLEIGRVDTATNPCPRDLFMNAVELERVRSLRYGTSAVLVMIEFISDRFDPSAVRKTEDCLYGMCRLIRAHTRATDCVCLYDDLHIGLLITHATPTMGQLVVERVRALLTKYASPDGKQVVFTKAGLGIQGLDGNLDQTPSQWIDAALTAARTSRAFSVDFTRKEAPPWDYQ
jgi:predicted RND superfamily exporter protein